MAQQIISSVENNFTKGLVTEFTGLNFPENAATDCDNCEFTIVGDVVRREGINVEVGASDKVTSYIGKAVSKYNWKTPGGDTTASILVKQIGNILYFYLGQNATVTSGISSTLSATTVDISTYSVTTFDSTIECSYADGNGYLFVFHENCDPFYVTYSNGTITSSIITIQIRDFVGADESGVAVNTRPTTLTNPHLYNLVNQGWISGSPWTAYSLPGTTGSGPPVGTGSLAFTVAAGITGVSPGQTVNIAVATTQYVYPPGATLGDGTSVMSGTVTSYSGTTMVINVTSEYSYVHGGSCGPYRITPANTGYINTWFTAEGNYPSNADVWWYFKDSSGGFNPATTAGNITLNTGPAPRGHFIFNAFNQTRSTLSSISGITDITTTKRPKVGCWFQGRVWYTGVNANQPASGTALFTSFTSNIYFSQVVQSPRDFGNCYQTNDPTSEQLFDILPTDGGVISIPEAGAVYNLFPVANGLIVFASNGVWFITGSQGIGFAANDYTITKLSNIRSTSYYSYVDVMGMPFFWNEEGIYQVTPGQGGQLSVESLTVSTIQTFYQDIPIGSRLYARGAYNPLDYVIKWIYKTTPETSVTDRYEFDGILNYNVYNKAFYPYTISAGSNNQHIDSIAYVTYPVITSTTPEPGFKYGSRFGDDGSASFQFSDERDTTYVDWGSSNFTSYFLTGYKLHGKGQFRFQVPYIYVFSRADGTKYGYKIQGVWDYATDPNSGRMSRQEVVYIDQEMFGMRFRRHRIRGRGITLQIKVTSVDGLPLDIMGWSTNELLNSGV